MGYFHFDEALSTFVARQANFMSNTNAQCAGAIVFFPRETSLSISHTSLLPDSDFNSFVTRMHILMHRLQCAYEFRRKRTG